MARCVCVWGHIQTKTKTLTHTHVLVHCTNPPRALVCLQHSRHTRPLLFLFSCFFFLSFFLKHLTSYALSFFISRSLCLCVFVLISSKFYDSFHLYYFFFFYKERLSGTVFLWNCLRVWLVDFLAFGFFFISRYQLFNIVSFCFLICGFCYI